MWPSSGRPPALLLEPRRCRFDLAAEEDPWKLWVGGRGGARGRKSAAGDEGAGGLGLSGAGCGLGASGAGEGLGLGGAGWGAGAGGGGDGKSPVCSRQHLRSMHSGAKK